MHDIPISTFHLSYLTMGQNVRSTYIIHVQLQYNLNVYQNTDFTEEEETLSLYRIQQNFIW